MTNDWTEILKDKLQDCAETPPTDLWPDISSRLSATSAPVGHGRGRRWLRVAACAAVVAGCALGLSTWDSGNADVLNPHDATPPLAYVDHAEHIVTSAQAVRAPMPVQKETIDVPATETPDTAYIPPHSAPTPVEEPRQKPFEEPWQEPIAEPATTKQRSGIALTLFASNIGFADRDQPNSMDAMGPDLSNPNRPGTSVDDENGDTPQSRGKTKATEPECSDAHHKQPLRFGLAVQWPLSGRLSIGTGITYSYLSSTLTWELGKRIYDTEQALHYIGVPVSVSYNVLTYRALDIYLTAGAMLEKCIYGRATSTDAPGGERISERQLQWSVSAGAGLQLRLYRNLSLYAEPLATYYFDNHSSIINIYKDRPLNIDLRLGLRYTFR